MTNINIKTGLSGHFRLITQGKTRGKLVQAEFDNLILDAGLDQIGVGASLSHCQVGTGSTPPSVSDTGLSSWLAGTSTQPVADQVSYVSGPPDYVQLVRTRRFAEGVAAGNLAEVGMGWGASGATLFSRELIRDAGGNPTTITVLSDETLDVEYTLRVYPPQSDITGTVNISGVDYNYTIRPSSVNSSASWNPVNLVGGRVVLAGGSSSSVQAYPSTSTLGARTGSPSGSFVGAYSSKSDAAYSAGSHEQVSTLTVGLTAGNASGGIGAMRFSFGSGLSSGASFQIGFSPALPKDASKILTLTFEFSWGRA